MMRIRATLAASAALLVAACGGTTAPSFAEDLAAITAFNERYLKSVNDGDMATLSSLTSEGHILLAPGRPPIVGKNANDAWNREALELFDFSETWTPAETVIDGDLAYQRGSYRTVVTPKDDGERIEASGSFLRIYRRQASGEWRMTHDMFNSDSASRGN